MNTLNLFMPISKVDEEKRLVYGILAEEIPDNSNEIFDYETSKPYLVKWSDGFEKATDGRSKGNLRAMHPQTRQMVAAGKFISIDFDDRAKTVTGCAKVVDDFEWNKVLEGVYTGFSIGGSYAARWKDPYNPKLTRYTANPIEISMVDKPCIPTATFQFVKVDGTIESRPLGKGNGSRAVRNYVIETSAIARHGSSFQEQAKRHSPAFMRPFLKEYGELDGALLLNKFSTETLERMDEAARLEALGELKGDFLVALVKLAQSRPIPWP